MTKILTLTIFICFAFGCAKSNSENPQNAQNTLSKQIQFYKPELITQVKHSPEHLELMSVVSAQLNDYFDFSNNSQQVLENLNLKVATRCEAEVQNHSYQLHKIPNKLYIHEILSRKNLQKILRAPILCDISINVYSENSYYLQPTSTLSISTADNAHENIGTFNFHDLQYEFDYEYFYNEDTSLICDHFTYTYDPKDHSSTVYGKTNAKLKKTAYKSYENKTYSQLCSYAKLQNGELILNHSFKVLYDIPTLQFEQKYFHIYKNKGIFFKANLKQISEKISEFKIKNPTNNTVQIRVPITQKALWLDTDRKTNSLVSAFIKTNSTHTEKSGYLYLNIASNKTAVFNSYISKDEVRNTCAYKKTVINRMSQPHQVDFFIKRIHLQAVKPIEMLVDSRWVPVMLPFASDIITSAKVDSISSQKLLNPEYQQEIFKKQKINLCR